ncbi:MAG: hypothetical protein U0835_04245 [Isosphaeraceae bacterium]
MSREFPEADWKVFRRLHSVALARYFEAALAEVKREVEDESVPSQQRFDRLLKLLKNHDREVARLFDDLRRSTAFLQLFQIVAKGLLTDEELAALTPATREALRSLLDPARD